MSETHPHADENTEGVENLCDQQGQLPGGGAGAGQLCRAPQTEGPCTGFNALLSPCWNS